MIGGDDVRQDLDEHDVRRALAAQLRGLHVVEVALGQHRGAHGARDDGREGQADHDDQRGHGRMPEAAMTRDHEDDQRDREDGVDEAAEDLVDEPRKYPDARGRERAGMVAEERRRGSDLDDVCASRRSRARARHGRSGRYRTDTSRSASGARPSVWKSGRSARGGSPGRRRPIQKPITKTDRPGTSSSAASCAIVSWRELLAGAGARRRVSRPTALTRRSEADARVEQRVRRCPPAPWRAR